ncbi:MAG TPA: peptide deformylase [Bacteroidia bacterium]|nr:peptide deformylase [Bacteroidia bacterium]
MIYPIIAYGNPVLKKKAIPVSADHPDLEKLIANMFETMYASSGVGLAAPQINKSIRLFVIDASPFADEDPQLDGFKKVFINPVMKDESGEPWKFNEGCLSIPGIREDVERLPFITLTYHDESFKEHTESFEGVLARIIQHEYDHIEGVLFTDLLSPLRKKLIKGKLNDIMKGKVDVDYKMRFVG